MPSCGINTGNSGNGFYRSTTSARYTFPLGLSHLSGSYWPAEKRLESGLHDEWFVTTIISTQPGWPLGVGAIVHCSLARHMTDCVIPCQEAKESESDKRAWAEAVDGRMLCIKITRTGSPQTWQFVGVYQHVAKRANRTAWALVRDALTGVINRAKKDGHRVAILGDFNAAPPGGRWGYS
jgi:hypothetical protein